MPSIKWLEARRKAQAVQNLGQAPITPEQERYLTVVGRGAQGKVYEGRPGQVVKYETGLSDPDVKMDLEGDVGDGEVQHIAANLGIAPKVDAIYQVVDPDTNLADRQIVQQDIRDQYQPVSHYLDDVKSAKGQEARDFAKRAILLEQAKQLGSLNLAGHNLTDRYPSNYGNIGIHSMTGRPTQLDFGYREILEDKVAMANALAENVKDGLIRAGLKDEGEILDATVGGLIENARSAYIGGYNGVGDARAAEALDVAKQGLGVLQKIKKPLATPAPTLLQKKPDPRDQVMSRHLQLDMQKEPDSNWALNYIMQQAGTELPELNTSDLAGHTGLLEVQRRLANMRTSEKQRENMRDLESQRKRYGLNSQEMPF